MMFWPVMFDMLAATAAVASPPPQDCRLIADPAARLACYDQRDAAPAASAPRPPEARVSQPSPSSVPPAAMPAPGPVAAAPAYAAPASQPPAASSAEIIRAARSGRIASVAALRYGLFRLTLDDGRIFETATNTDSPPAVGTSVKLRRSVIGTTFLDVPGRSPITVRLVRQYR